MRRYPLLAAVFALSCVTNLKAENQTSTLNAVIQNGNLPYEIELKVDNLHGATLPTLQSFASGVYNGQWVLVAGRTNGLHNFTNSGLKNFPPAFQNTDIWVIDPVAGKSWKRSINRQDAGLVNSEVSALSATNTAFAQRGNQLYIAGGYVYDRVKNNFTTFDTLTALDLPEVIDWVKTGKGTLRDHVRQTHNSFLKVAGGVMFLNDDRALIVFGQNFEGPYNPGASGIYTKQVRTFDIVDDGNKLSIEHLSANERRDYYRRRDLNVVPVLEKKGNGELSEGFVAFSGVFLPGKTGGAWTVPVEITASGKPSMASPTAPNTFKQGMNNYACATVSLYSKKRNESHTIAMGGISLKYFNPNTNKIAIDPQIPFINGITSIVRRPGGIYRQHYLGEYPTIPNPENGNQPFLFGAEAAFFPSGAVDLYDNGMLNLDRIDKGMVIGHVFGGIVAEKPNFGNSAASNYAFAVKLTPLVRFKVSGGNHLVTSAATIKVRGTASPATRYVEWKYAGDSTLHREAVVDGEWSARIGNLTKGGETVVYFRATGGGNFTRFKKVEITRR